MKVAIVGGGVSGLIASYVLRQHRDVDVTIYEPGRPGAAFLAGGLKYLNRSPQVLEMLEDFDMMYTPYSTKGGILLKGNVEPYPGCLPKMEKDKARRVQRDHYRKTRRVEADDFAAKSMNDPEANAANNRAVSADLPTLVKHLTDQATIVKAQVGEVATMTYQNAVQFSAGNEVLTCDRMIMTLPIWVARRIVDFHLPEVQAMKLNIVQVEPHRDPYARWDYVYTPYTPENLIHRISPHDSGYSCEFNGEWVRGDSQDALTSELNFLFPDGWIINDLKTGLNGHLLPPSEKPEWHERVAPLGRFARWDPRATTDVTMSNAFKLAESWGLVHN